MSRKNRRLRFVPPGWAVLALLVLAAPAAAAGSTLAEIRERGELVMLCFPHQNSIFVRVHLEAGPMPKIGGTEHFEGIDVEILSAFAKELGVELLVRPVRKPGYKTLIRDLTSRKGDVIASSFSITEERKKQVAFSDPYFTVQPIVVTAADSSLAGVEDLAGRRPVIVSGTSNHTRLLELGVAIEKPIVVGFMIEAFDKILKGEADFTLLDSAARRTDIGVGKKLKVAFTLSASDDYGIAVPLGSDLVLPLNRFLDRFRKSGELDEVIRRYLTTP